MGQPRRKKEKIEYISIEKESDLLEKLEKGELQVKKPLDKHSGDFKAPFYETIHIFYYGEKIVQYRFQCSLCKKLFHVDRSTNGTNQLSRHPCVVNLNKKNANENSEIVQIQANQSSQSQNAPIDAAHESDRSQVVQMQTAESSQPIGERVSNQIQNDVTDDLIQISKQELMTVLAEICAAGHVFGMVHIQQFREIMPPRFGTDTT